MGLRYVHRCVGGASGRGGRVRVVEGVARVAVFHLYTV